MRSALAAALLAILAAPANRGLAQTAAEPRLVLSVFGGISAGRHAWEIPRQPLLVLGTELSPRYDTLRHARKVRPGLVLGLSGTFFRSARLGLSAEMVFLGLTTEDQCTMVYENVGTDPQNRNAQLCGDIANSGVTPTTVAFSVGGVIRPLPGSAVSPYVRAQAGLAALSGNLISMVGSFTSGGSQLERIVVNDPSGSRLGPSLGGAVGLMIPAGAGNQIRFELRDQILFPRRATGPATDVNAATAPTETFALHNVALTVAFDIVLEQKRGRRY